MEEKTRLPKITFGRRNLNDTASLVPELPPKNSWTTRSIRKVPSHQDFDSPIGNNKTPLGSLSERLSRNRPAENVNQDRLKVGWNRRKITEKLVGLNVPAKVGLEVEYSQEAIKYYNRTQQSMPGFITNIDADGSMCIVCWDDGSSDYSCIGYKGKYFLVVRENNHVGISDEREREYNLRHALDAALAPKFQLDPETNLWRLKSKVKDERSFVKKLKEGKEFLHCVVLPEVRKQIKIQKQEEEIAKQRSMEESLKNKMKLANFVKNETEDIRRLKHLLGNNPRQTDLIREEVLKESLSSALARHHQQALGLGSNFLAYVQPGMSFPRREDGLPLWLLRSRHLSRKIAHAGI